MPTELWKQTMHLNKMADPVYAQSYNEEVRRLQFYDRLAHPTKQPWWLVAIICVLMILYIPVGIVAALIFPGRSYYR